MLELKNKVPPSPQILRLKEWFSRYDFTVKHIKGNKNVIPDYLSRPKEVQSQQHQLKENIRTILIFIDTHEYPLIMMNEPLDKGSSSQNFHEFPPELLRIQPITPTVIKSFAETHMFHYLAITIQEHQIKPKSTWFNPAAPYLNIFPLLMDKMFTEADMWYLWCTTVIFKYPLSFPLSKPLNISWTEKTRTPCSGNFFHGILPYIGGKNRFTENYADSMFGN